MKTNDMTFFHEGTLQICGSLEVSEILKNSLFFLKRYMPLSGILLDYYDPEIGGLRALGLESVIKVNQLDKPIMLPKSEQQMILDREHTDNSELVNHPDSTPISQRIGAALGLKKPSFLALRLRVKKSRLGVVVLFSEDANLFTEEHQRLLKLLHDPLALAMSNIHRFDELKRLKENLKDDNRYLFNELHMISGDEIIGRSSGLRDVIDSVNQVAELNSNVLLLGETGVGKEVIANAIHYTSSRRDGPLIKVNCGAIPDNLIDSELFGHEKGAFTGAISQKRGRFERAHGGTIFLDEIGELHSNAQVRLLRVIQDRHIERIGGNKPIPVNVRIMAATHRNLQKMVENGDFREDLWFRLNVFPITIPPLRDRVDDIPDLVTYFIDRKTQEMKLNHRPFVSPAAFNRLKQYDWPGNVRELENVVEREIIRNRRHRSNEHLTFMDFTSSIAANPPVSGSHISISPEACLNLEDVIRTHIKGVLQLTQGKIQGKDGAAVKLGLHSSTLRHRLRKLGIPFGQSSSKSIPES